jgi:hypothetical protein
MLSTIYITLFCVFALASRTFAAISNDNTQTHESSVDPSDVLIQGLPQNGWLYEMRDKINAQRAAFYLPPLCVNS